MSGVPIDGDYIKSESKQGRIGQKLLAVVAQGSRGRVYLPPDSLQEQAANVDVNWKPNVEFFDKALGFRVGNYGMRYWGDLFTPRQLLSLSTFSNLIQEARKKIIEDAANAGLEDDGIGLDEGGSGATAYGEAISVYLAFAVDRLADYNSTIATWKPSGEQVMQTYKRQAVPMTWDFPESNVMGEKAICWKKQ